MIYTDNIKPYRFRLFTCCFLFFTEDQLPAGFPTIDMGPQLKVVERSRTATMLCAASGNPDPEITWFKDFLPVNTSNNNGRIKQLRSGNHFTYVPILRPFLFRPMLLSPARGLLSSSRLLCQLLLSALNVLFFSSYIPWVIFWPVFTSS